MVNLMTFDLTLILQAFDFFNIQYIKDIIITRILEKF